MIKTGPIYLTLFPKLIPIIQQITTNSTEALQFYNCLLVHHIPKHQKIYFDTKIKFLPNLEDEIGTF